MRHWRRWRRWRHRRRLFGWMDEMFDASLVGRNYLGRYYKRLAVVIIARMMRTGGMRGGGEGISDHWRRRRRRLSKSYWLDDDLIMQLSGRFSSDYCISIRSMPCFPSHATWMLLIVYHARRPTRASSITFRSIPSYFWSQVNCEWIVIDCSIGILPRLVAGPESLLGIAECRYDSQVEGRRGGEVGRREGQWGGVRGRRPVGLIQQRLIAS